MRMETGGASVAEERQMSRSVLVIHGAGEPRRRGGKVYREPMLGKALGPEYRVQAPRMPQPTNPRYQIWASRIAQLIDAEASPVLVGHSFGASMLLKYLEEAAARPSFAGLFLIATPILGPRFPRVRVTARFRVAAS